jgi:hypothetical protein
MDFKSSDRQLSILCRGREQHVLELLEGALVLAIFLLGGHCGNSSQDELQNNQAHSSE